MKKIKIPIFQNWLRASLKWLAISLLFALSVVSCTIHKPTFPVAIFPKEMPKIPEPDAAAAQVPAGYKVEVFMKDLIWPSSIDFDESGNVYVSEARFRVRILCPSKSQRADISPCVLLMVMLAS